MAGLAAAGNLVRLLDRNALSVLQMTKATRWQINRRLCTKPPEGSAPKPSDTPFKLPGYKPSNWDKKILVWTGRFKKPEDIPETMPFEVVDVARNKMRVRISYLMIAVTLMGCLGMVIVGKRAVARHESLTSINLEKKARLRDEAQNTLAKP